MRLFLANALLLGALLWAILLDDGTRGDTTPSVPIQALTRTAETTAASAILDEVVPDQDMPTEDVSDRDVPTELKPDASTTPEVALEQAHVPAPEPTRVAPPAVDPPTTTTALPPVPATEVQAPLPAETPTAALVPNRADLQDLAAQLEAYYLNDLP